MIQKQAKQKRNPVRQCIGLMMPGGIVDQNGAMELLGLGENSISQARRSGIVKPIPCGRKVFYKTSQIIAWIESHAE